MPEPRAPAWTLLMALALLPLSARIIAAEPLQSDGIENAPGENAPGVGAPQFDGEPQWAAIPGTPLSYAANMATPLIRVDGHTYYALENSVWFAATTPGGPWVVAASVPAIVYSIPPSSPLYFVTFVRTDGSAGVSDCRPAILGAYAGPNSRVYATATGCSRPPWAGSPYVPLDAYGYYGYGAPWGGRYGGPWNSRDRVDHHRPDRR